MEFESGGWNRRAPWYTAGNGSQGRSEGKEIAAWLLRSRTIDGRRRMPF